MKKFIIIGALLLALSVNAQTTIYTGDGFLSGNRIVNLNGRNLHFKPSTTINGLVIAQPGNVGINNLNPTEKLDVNGNIQSTIGIFTNSLVNGQTFASYEDRNYKCTVLAAGTMLNPLQRARTFQFFDFPQSNIDSQPTVFMGIEDRNYKARMQFYARASSESVFLLQDKNQTENLRIHEDGNGKVTLTMPKTNSFIGIGTTSFTDGSDVYKLSVSGKIRAHEVKVYTTWADYVFEDDYKMKSLEEVEQYIKENGHLPNVPSAAVIEEKGLELGNMMKIQQEKIEELTLYLIEQKKENDQLKKDVEDLKAAVKALTNKQ